jgi:hypothetical protein
LNTKLAKKILDEPHKLGHALGLDRLTKLHDEWIKYIWRTNESRTLQAHRGSYKTTAVAVLGAIIHIIFKPDDRILILRKEFNDNVKPVMEEIAKYLKTDVIKELVRQLYGIDDFHLVKETTSEITTSLMTRICREPNIKGSAIGKSLTGGHYERVLTDDIVTLKDRLSSAERERTKSVFHELINIVDPGCPISNVGTCWHPDDAFTVMPEPLRYNIYQTDLPAFTEKHIENLKSKMPNSIFSINYMLEHTSDEDKEFTDPAYGDWPEYMKPIGHVDKKYAGKDTGAVTFMGRYNGKIHAYGFLFKTHIEDNYNKISRAHSERNATVMYTEDNDDKGLAAGQLSNRGIVVETYHESVNKHYKIMTYMKRYWKEIIWDHRTDPDYLLQITEYTEDAEHDDAIDSASSCLRALGDDIDIDDALDFYT